MPSSRDYVGTASHAAILGQIRELAASISDERIPRVVVQKVTDAFEVNPQPIPPSF